MKLGRYETLVRLGRGGMAEVFAARLTGEAGFSKLVAIKRILPHLAGDRGLVARFHDEARLAAMIASPHVVQTLDVGRSADGHPFLVLELVLGVSLARLLMQRPLPSLDVRLELVTQAALGLADVHEAKAPDGTPLEIVHRDVSPHNILVGQDGRARLADFGIARANVPREETRTGVVLGKFGYMPPEQLRGGALDARTDVYAMGVVIFEALTGRRLHRGATPEQITERILDGRTGPPPEIEEQLPEPIARVVERALAPDPDARFPNGRELAEALREVASARVPRKVLVDEVRRAAGSSLRELEAAIAELGRDADEERTATLNVEGATVSGLIGSWDPSAQTASLSHDDVTTADPLDHEAETVLVAPATREPPPRRPFVVRPVYVAWSVVAALAIGAAVAGAIAGGSGPEPAAPVAQPAPAPAPPAEPRVVTPDPEPAPAPSAIEPVVIEPDQPPAERPRRRPRHRDREPDRPSGPLLGTDRFDEAER